MWIDQIYEKKLAYLWVSSLSFSSGLFGLFNLEISNHRKDQSKIFQWTHSCQKNIKNYFFLCLAFDLAFLTFIGLFQFFCGLWSLKSPLSCSSDINNTSIIQYNFCLKYPIFNQCAPSTSGTFKELEAPQRSWLGRLKMPGEKV